MMGNNTPGTPQFFNQAMMDSTPMPTPQRSGNKMPLIILAVAAFVILAIVIIVLAISNNVPKGSAIADFKSLVNFAVNGKTDEVIDTSYDLTKGTEIVRRSQDYEHNKAYFKDIEEKSKNVIESVKKSDLEQSIKDDMITYAYSLMAYARLREYSSYEESLVETYMNDRNYDRTVRRVNEHYEDLINNGNENIKAGAEELASGVKQYLYIVNEISVNNLDVRNLDESMREFYSDEQYMSYLSQLNRSFVNAQRYIGKELNANILKSWDIITALGAYDEK